MAALPGAKSHVVSLSASLQAHVKPLNWYAEGSGESCQAVVLVFAICLW